VEVSLVFSLSSFFRSAITVAPHLPNPSDGGRHWYHGTSETFYNDPEKRRSTAPDPAGEHNLSSPHLNPTAPPPGGRLEHYGPVGSEYGENSDKHWNTDLGTHFTSDRWTARSFASGRPGSGSSPVPESRIAHCRLHIGNPKHYDSEFDMSRDAIRWAHKNGHEYDHDGLFNDDDARRAFIDGEWDNDDVSEAHHLHPVMDAFMITPAHREAIANIDANGPGDRGGEHLDHYLRFHPDREEITSGFKRHLQDQGHDGVTYGNEYEGSKGHHCAIAFDDEQIHMKKWEWLHESSPHRHQQPRERGQDHLINPDGRGHYLVNPKATASLLSHFASAEPIWRQPKPKYQTTPEGSTDDEILAHGDRQRRIQNTWTHEVRKALSRGDLHPEEAKANGYHGRGHDQDTGYDAPRHGLAWKPLPQTLWHVTTNKTAVLHDGTLKSRDELSQRGGNGLGGGESDTISFTDDPEVAHHIHRALHEYHSVLNGKITPHDMMRQAHEGGFEKHMVYSHGGPHPDSGEWKHGDPYPEGLQNVLNGVEHHNATHTVEEARAKYGEDVQPHPRSTPIRFGGKEMHTAWHQPVHGDDLMRQRSQFYKTFATWRQFTGGHMDPGFIMNDEKGLAASHPSEFAVLRCHPKPGAQGYQVSALGEWRTVDGSVAHVAGIEPAHEHAHLAKQAARRDTTRMSVSKLLEYALPRSSDAVDEQKVRQYAEQMRQSGYDEDSADADDDHIRVLNGRVLNGNHRIHAASDAGLKHLPVEVLNEGHLAKTASADGYLANPYHHHDEWFHGTIGEYEGHPDPAAVHAGHQAPGPGFGGPQMNRLLGVHFSPLHSVAHGFAGEHHGTAHGRIFHARLKMKNPVHFANEHDLLRHVWNTTMRSDHFHDDKHDENHRWNYGSGATRAGINSRLDAPQPKDRPGPHSSMESYLQFHPRQKEIAEAYVKHLRYEGHDGITYGNDVEGPKGHHCAIAFDPKTIEVTHTDQMHPKGSVSSAWPEESKRLAQERRPGEVEHRHIRSIHGEPEHLLDEVERYHNGGLTRQDKGWSYLRENTGKGEWTWTAAKTGPLPMEDGLYYRLHGKDQPFGPEHASTRNIGEAPHPDLAKYWEPKPGYSAFWNPHHLHQYLDEMGWRDEEHLKNSQVLAFRGRPIGEGADGEPRGCEVANQRAGARESTSWTQAVLLGL
jgi:hypothetical protein